MSQPDPPKARDPVKDYQAGLDVYLKNLPRLLDAEDQAREGYDPLRIEQQMALEEIYGPERTRLDRERLQRLDPDAWALREKMMKTVSDDLADPYSLSPAFRTQMEQEIRGSQASRGNILGNAPGSAESLYKGRGMLDLYNRRLANAGTALSMNGPVQQLGTAPVMADRGASYTVGGLGAGQQGVGWGANMFNQQMQQHQNQPNQWANALGGAASGAAAGGAVGGVWGAAIGGVAGGAAGYFSDRQLKEDIERVGTSPSGLGIYEFRYRNGTQRYRGTMADEVEKVCPEAVTTLGDFKAVRYDMIDVDFEYAGGR